MNMDMRTVIRAGCTGYAITLLGYSGYSGFTNDVFSGLLAAAVLLSLTFIPKRKSLRGRDK